MGEAMTDEHGLIAEALAALESDASAKQREEAFDKLRDHWFPKQVGRAPVSAQGLATRPMSPAQKASSQSVSGEREQAIQQARRACECREPDPVQQADGKFYCYQCSFETGARPQQLEPEATLRALQAEIERLKTRQPDITIMQAAAIMATLKEECERQHARAERAEALLAASRPSQEEEITPEGREMLRGSISYWQKRAERAEAALQSRASQDKEQAFIIRECIHIIEACFDGEYVTSYNGLINALNDLKTVANQLEPPSIKETT